MTRSGSAVDPASPERTASLADRLAEVVAAVPGVAGLHAGTFGEVATYLAGRRVAGIRLSAERIELHLTVDWGADLLATADAARAAAAAVPAADGRPVHVIIEDVASRSDPTRDTTEETT